MKFIPILYSTPMVQAILEDRKTMTRRIVKPQPFDTDLGIGEFHQVVIDKNGDEQPGELTFGAISNDGELCVKCPYGQPGDVLWVRENYQIYNNDGGRQIYITTESEIETFRTYNYRDISATTLDKVKKIDTHKWISKPSIFLFKDFCRIFLKIKSIRVERLQDISEEDAKAEGALLHERGRYWLNYVDQKHGLTQFIYNCRTAKESFISLWDLINGKDSRLANPWVWVIEFEKIERPAGFLN